MAPGKNPLLALLVVRLKELSREPAVLFWNFVFPALLSVALGFVRTHAPQTATVAVVADRQTFDAIAQVEGVRAAALDGAAADELFRSGRCALVVTRRPSAVEYRYDPGRTEAALARARIDAALQRAAGRSDVIRSADRHASQSAARYVDFLVPGIVALNLMNGGLWGVGFSLVKMRIRNVLKTLAASPMRREHFFLSLLLSRLLLVTVEVTVLVCLTSVLFDIEVRGSPIQIIALALLGALTFSAIGLLLAARTETLDTISGLINAVVLPMFVLSGVFFSIDRLPGAAQAVSTFLPLTALTEALRATIIHGLSLAQISHHVLVLAIWGAVSFAVSLRLFRWV